MQTDVLRQALSYALSTLKDEDLLASYLGVSKDDLNAWRNGTSHPSGFPLHRLSALLAEAARPEVTSAELLETV
jgi:DNA-binding transcriptional regulator YiaG